MAKTFKFIGGFREATATVQNARACVETLSGISGWEPIDSGELNPALLAGWGLDASVRGHHVLLRNPGDNRGYLRVQQLHGLTQEPIRSNPQTWDSGGIIDLNVRVIDLDDKFKRLRAAGWHSTADPVRWTFGASEVVEWIGIGPDGLAIAIIERLSPPLQGWDTLKAFSRVFNSSQIVTDMGRARAFYEGGLGFKKVLQQSTPLGHSPMANVLGIPHNLVPTVKVEIVILQPEGQMDGSVELVKFHGLEGRNFADNALPYNLGVGSLRFEVEGVDGLLATLTAAGWPVAMAPVGITLPPYGEVTIAAVTAPDSAWLEFFESR